MFLFIRFSHDNNVFKKARNSIVSMYIKPEAIIKMLFNSSSEKEIIFS